MSTASPQSMHELSRWLRTLAAAAEALAPLIEASPSIAAIDPAAPAVATPAAHGGGPAVAKQPHEPAAAPQSVRGDKRAKVIAAIESMPDANILDLVKATGCSRSYVAGIANEIKKKGAAKT